MVRAIHDEVFSSRRGGYWRIGTMLSLSK
jgi:hypothetical protein